MIGYNQKPAMSWQDQGRQQHGWFGSGTSGTEPETDTRAAAVKIGYAALSHLAAPHRGRYEGWLNRGGLAHIAAVLPGWRAGSSLSDARFHDVFIGPQGAQSLAGPARKVGLALAAPTPEPWDAVQSAGEHFADFVTAARPEAIGRVMASAAAQAETPAALNLVQQAAARPQPAARPAAPAPTPAPARAPARPASPAERKAAAQRQSNIAALATVIYNEARGNGRDAMVAVGHTLRNRMLRNGVSTVQEVWGGYDRRAATPELPGDIAAYALAKEVAEGIIRGTIADPTNGATHYYSPQSMANEEEPVRGDVAGGLEDVPGVLSTDRSRHVRNYQPGWTSAFDPRPMPAIPERFFKFYRQPDGGRRVR